MSYTPHRGSIAHRAIEHLRYAGGDVALKVLAEAIDTDAQTMRMALGTAVDQGVVTKALHNGLSWYRIGDGVPLVKDEDTEAAPAGPARNGSQTPDDAGSISGARAGSEPKGLAGTARGPETAEETTTGRSEAPTAAAQAPAAGDDAKRDGRPASPGGQTRKVKAPRTVGKKPKLAKTPRQVTKRRADVAKSRPALGETPPSLAVAKPEVTPVEEITYICGELSNQTFVQEKDGVRMVLELAEARVALRFLARMCGVPA